jgi:hypothetical protein
MAEALPLNFSTLSQTIDDILETLPQIKFIKNNRQGDDICFNNHVYSI